MTGSITSKLAAGSRFELMPFDSVRKQLSALPVCATVTVTSSPEKDIESTLSFAGELKRKGFNVVPHIAARKVRDTIHLRNILLILADLGISEIFVIGGDDSKPAGEFDSSFKLLATMSQMPRRVKRIGIAGYPEGHSSIDSGILDFALDAKARYADYIVTQMCFDYRAILNWTRRIEKRGIMQPVYIGIPGVTQRTKLLKIGAKIGVGKSLRFAKKHKSLFAQILRPGTSHTERLVSKLRTPIEDRSVNIEGFHIFTFNDLASSESLRQALVHRFE